MIERPSQDYRDAITLVEIDGLTQQAAAKQMLEDCCLIELDRRGGVADYEPRSKVGTPCTKGERCSKTDGT